MKMYMTIMPMIMIISTIFSSLKHPLAMGLMLIIYSTLTSITSSIINETPWFSYTLFMIFLGGVLVLLIYMTSLASNEMFSMNMQMITTVLITTLLAIIITALLDPLTLMSPMMTQETLLDINNTNYIPTMTKLYSKSNSMTTITMASYLFLTLIVVTKNANKSHGPLRPTK